MYKDKRYNDDPLNIGVKGLPEHYPTPNVNDMLFYIQRNQNENTVIYKINVSTDGSLDREHPFEVYWKNYDCKKPDSKINLIQQKLAYGVQYDFITDDLIEINIVSYPIYKIMISRNYNGEWGSYSKISGSWANLTNVYVYAEEFGAFPVVKYLELYGTRTSDSMPCYEKIII